MQSASRATELRCRSCGAVLPDGSAPTVPARFAICKACGWEPNDGPQRRFLAETSYEALYGGAAGGGKTEALVMAPLRWVGERGFRALILRRTFPELNRDIVPLMFEHYPTAGGKPHVSDSTWRFPSGAVIEYGHVERDADVHKYQGLEVQYLAFDELTSFTERQYTYLLSRVRSANGVPVRVRSATNPGGEGHDWVMKRWAPWLDKRAEYKGARAEAGQVLHYRNGEKEEEWCPRGVDTLTRVFVPARLADNPHLMANDPGYLTRLGGLDRVTRAQLRDGDWLAKPGAGKYYQRGWFRFLDVRPQAVVARVRRWDLASTENGGDWTVGVRMSLLRDRTFVEEDVLRQQLRPGGVEELIKATAMLDGKDVHIVLPEDPGQAGKAQAAAFAKMLSGYVVHFVRETGDKVTRQGPYSAQCEAGNVVMVRAPWNEVHIQEKEAFPDGAHDDDVDAAAGAFTYLNEQIADIEYLEAMKRLAGEMRR